MSSNDDSNKASQLSRLADQGQRWEFVSDRPIFELPGTFLDRPLELTIKELRGIRMVDETSIIIRSTLTSEREG